MIYLGGYRFVGKNLFYPYGPGRGWKVKSVLKTHRPQKQRVLPDPPKVGHSARHFKKDALNGSFLASRSRA